MPECVCLCYKTYESALKPNAMQIFKKWMPSQSKPNRNNTLGS